MVVNGTGPFEVDEIIVYSCQEGYANITGDTVLQCVGNGTWDGTSAPTCELIRK